MGQLAVVVRSSFVGAWVVGLLAGGELALAIPNQHLNPHSDAPADISWQNTPGDPETHNHTHLVLRTGETITQNATSISSNKGWKADSVWDDRFFRFADTPAADGGANALANLFGHGYVDPTFRPRYTFGGAVAEDAKPILIGDFAAWDTAAKAAAASAGNKTPAGTPTKTSIAFENVTSGTAEFQIQFYDNFQATQGAFAEWMPSAEQRAAGTPVGAGDIIVMGYEANPTNSVFTRDAWQLRLKDSDPIIDGDQPGPWVDTLTEAVGWFYGAGVPTLFGSYDLEYRNGVAGEIVDVLPDTTALDTNTFGTISGDATDVVDFYLMDFQTIALHETGHILGLLHDPTSAEGAAANIMRSQIALNAGFGNTMRAIDADSAYGAALLYTIPIPEPASVLVAFGMLAIFTAARRRKNV